MVDYRKSTTAGVGHHLLVGALAAAATVGATNAVAAVDIFLKIADIKGESKDSKHSGEIDLLTWSWGVNGPTVPDKQKALAQPACAEPLSVTKFVDRATPPLVTSAALNTTIPSATLTVRKAGETPIEFLVLNLAGVTVKSLATGGSTGEDRLTENVSLGFTSATITYTPQKADGSADTPVSATAPGSCP
jgi:type VI secretion system secreted protein Hcp